MTLFNRTRHSLRRFRRDDSGSVSVEAAMYLPLLLGVFAATYTLFDLFKQESVNTKAAYTVSDLISRETVALNDEYIDSMYELTQVLARADSGMSLRISVINWDEDEDRYYVDWSVERGDRMDVLTDQTVDAVEAKLPSMPDGERVIVVETWNDVDPVFNVGLDSLDIYNFVFTRPRFASLVAFEGQVTSDGPAHDDDTESTDVS